LVCFSYAWNTLFPALGTQVLAVQLRATHGT